VSEKEARLPIDRPCSACSAGDTEMEYHLHRPPFRTPSAPQAACRDQFGHNTEACTGECSTERDELVEAARVALPQFEELVNEYHGEDRDEDCYLCSVLERLRRALAGRAKQ
jgi:hypothetical protein